MIDSSEWRVGAFDWASPPSPTDGGRSFLIIPSPPEPDSTLHHSEWKYQRVDSAPRSNLSLLQAGNYRRYLWSINMQAIFSALRPIGVFATTMHFKGPLWLKPFFVFVFVYWNGFRWPLDTHSGSVVTSIQRERESAQGEKERKRTNKKKSQCDDRQSCERVSENDRQTDGKQSVLLHSSYIYIGIQLHGNKRDCLLELQPWLKLQTWINGWDLYKLNKRSTLNLRLLQELPNTQKVRYYLTFSIATMKFKDKWGGSRWGGSHVQK